MSSSAIDTQLLRVVCAQTNFRVKVRLHPKLSNDTTHNNKATTQSISQKSTHSSTGQATTTVAAVSTATGVGAAARVVSAGASAAAVVGTGVGSVAYDGQEEVTHLLESGSVIEVYTELVEGFYKLIDNQVCCHIHIHVHSFLVCTCILMSFVSIHIGLCKPTDQGSSLRTYHYTHHY